MPTVGLKNLEILRLQDTDTLKMFPSIYNFERFVALMHNKYCSGEPTELPLLHILRRRRESEDFGHLVFFPDNVTQPHRSPDWGAIERLDRNPSGADGVFHQSTVTVSPQLIQAYCGNVSRSPRDVLCRPSPDAFNPCEDLMGNWGLRGAVWVVALLALVGNLAVLVVLLSSRFRMTVPKLLMCNLAVADLCMGIYLILIAVMDAHSIGEYFNHAIDWQRVGHIREHRAALLRNFIASCRLHQLFLTCICLPMENRDLGDLLYLVTLLLVNGLAFILICACYGRIYCAIRGQNTPAARSDTTVAKRMALLVFTDFACWAPIAFFGLTAVAGFPLIDVPHTKILLVFFYPLNSCANPYLYALLTKQYRRDLFTLLSRSGLCKRKSVHSSEPNCTGGSACTPEEVTPRSRVAPAPSTIKPRSSSSAEGSQHRGSPHPLRNSNTRLNLSGDQEMILRKILDQPTPVFIQPDADSHL
ncbi:Follicle-stimulating hormone receptor [Blattella germanica]|nr:Follicle-stimulating hormone receptor [Blattella germanica]